LNSYGYGSQYSSILDITTSAKVPITEIIKLMFYSFGQSIILVIATILSIIYLIKTKGLDKLNFFELISITEFALFLVLSSLGFFLSYYISFNRIFMFTIPFSLILIASCINRILTQDKTERNSKNFFLVICFLALISIVYLSTFNLYPSPLIKKENQQVTAGELKGMETFFEKRNDSVRTLQLGITQLEFYNAIYGRLAKKTNILYGDITFPPDHFGYLNNTSLAQMHDMPLYLALTSLGRNYYSNIFPGYKKYWRFTEEDFSRLENDPGVDEVYLNGDITIYLIK
jgi:hypothetical protein